MELFHIVEKKKHKRERERGKLAMGHDVEAKGVNGNREATNERIFDGIHLRIYTEQTQLLPLPHQRRIGLIDSSSSEAHSDSILKKVTQPITPFLVISCACGSSSPISGQSLQPNMHCFHCTGSRISTPVHVDGTATFSCSCVLIGIRS